MIFFLLPAYNEAESLPCTLQNIHMQMTKREEQYQIIVCNNNSADTTEYVSIQSNAKVVTETKKGYGHTLMKGVLYIQQEYSDIPDHEKILIFMDADGQDSPENICVHLENLNSVEFSIASRITKSSVHKLLTPHQKKRNDDNAVSVFHSLANALFGVLLFVRTKKRFTDLGPFRALRMDAFLRLEMKEYTYGWTAEMQKKVALKNISYTEFYSPPKKRQAGTSTISGSAIWKQIRIGLYIIWVIIK